MVSSVVIHSARHRQGYRPYLFLFDSQCQRPGTTLHPYTDYMVEPRRFRTDVRQLLRDRVLDTARDLVTERGWSAVNMSRIAREVGISRATLYNEVGSRQNLASALVTREADRFLNGVVQSIRSAPDIVDGLTAAAEHTLAVGDDNELLRAVVADRQQESELLSLVAVDTDTVLGHAADLVAVEVRSRLPGLDELTAGTLTEVFVRLTVSHLLQPRGPHAAAAQQIRAVVSGLLAVQPRPAN